MNQNGGIFYLCPDYFMSTKDFYKYYEIRILIKGLDNMEGETLALCVGFIGRTSNNTSIKYKINIKDIVKLMASKGIKMIAPPKIDSEKLAGLPLNLNKIYKENTQLLTLEKRHVLL